jgi:DNA replication protein DnaC
LEPQTSPNPFLNIPRRKLDDALEEIARLYSKNGVLTQEGAILAEAFSLYYFANIPVDYWWREMADWKGPATLKKYYDDIVADLKGSFNQGKRAMLGGKHGVGKTLTCACILKRVLETRKYSAQYVNLADIVHVMLNSPSGEKTEARNILLDVDFLVIDELDTRFMGSENAADLFGRILEPVMRTRIQNRMPLYFCTNSSKVEESFSGPLRASIESLMKVVKFIPVIGGQDAREQIKKGEL